MTADHLIDGPARPNAWLLLAHGAGAGMTSPVIGQLTALLAERHLRVFRFEFAYMAARRSGGTKRPPPKIEVLCQEMRATIDRVRASMPEDPKTKLLIGGKSMGGRVASLIADGLFAKNEISGWYAFGFPFHPAGKPEKLRTAHLSAMTCRGLIVQGTRDPLGNQKEVAGYKLSPAIDISWSADGDHDLKPLKASGRTHQEALAAAADSVAKFANTL